MKKLLFITLMLAFGLTGFSQTTWTGSVDIDWATAGNWNPATVPTFFDHVIIPDVANDPVIGSGTTDAACNNLTINSNASLTVDGKLAYLGEVTVNGTFDVNGIVETATVTSAGETWMDRNLGALQVATSSTDADAYGDLYQWGRFKEGHEKRNSYDYVYPVPTAAPNEGNAWDGKFIIPKEHWLYPHNNTLWQGVSGTNNPCPAGFRLPTEAEWDAELLSWASNDAAGAFGSPLKLTVGGFRHYNVGMLDAVDALGFYWSSTTLIDGDLYLVKTLRIAGSGGGSTHIYSEHRGYGVSVRCIKD